MSGLEKSGGMIGNILGGGKPDVKNVMNVVSVNIGNTKIPDIESYKETRIRFSDFFVFNWLADFFIIPENPVSIFNKFKGLHRGAKICKLNDFIPRFFVISEPNLSYRI